MDIFDLSSLIKRKEISPIDLVKEKLKIIEEKNSDINAFITVTAEEALNKARVLEEELQKGLYRGLLHGIPIAIKDLIYTKGIPTTSGSKIYRNFIPSEDATVIKKLKKEGAIILGKLNTHEFAYGPMGDRSYFGPCRNPHNLDRIAGGSSSGSGASVASNMVLASLGTDTGGSVRIPASACGVVGMKPTFGLISKSGVFSLAHTLDHIGLVTRSVRDNAALLNVVVGYDSKDPHSKKLKNIPNYVKGSLQSIDEVKIGVATNTYFTDVEIEVEKTIDKTINVLKELGASIIEVEVPNIEEIAEAQSLTIKAEAVANHIEGLDSIYLGNIDEEVYQRLQDSKKVTGYEYVEAQMKRSKFISTLNKLFDKIDVLVVPTLPIIPTKINQRQVKLNDSTVSVRDALLKLTSPFNYTGNPAISIPGGISTTGLPIGVQLIGRHYEEKKLYQVGYHVEQYLLNQKI